MFSVFKTDRLSLPLSVWAASQNAYGARTAAQPAPNPTKKSGAQTIPIGQERL